MVAAAQSYEPALLQPSEGSELACIHCGAPVPRARRGAALQPFCCEGCRTVYSVIQEHGLQRYYAERERAGGDAGAAPAKPTRRRYGELDEPRFQALHCE
ncbi:MAG TPA: heavy metal translocating P-type ATPase metal-binding domain-containing protein, partial [Polyangiaceae bacterium]|nr:heavy metal translocating P-type ATPase metal-binding domain-containing protein [Polyangiaceae bacterium]